MKIYQVALIDDHAIFRKGLALMLNQFSNVKVVKQAESGEEFLDFIKNNKIDIAFMDIKMPSKDGIETTREALAIDKKVKIIAMTMFEAPEFFYQMVEAGVAGFLTKNADEAEIAKAIERVTQGGNYFANELVEKYSKDKGLISPTTKEPINKVLTRREKQILQLICQGISNAQIAEQLHISERTVQGHRANLIKKTGTSNSIDLVIFAVKNGIVKL